MFRRGKRDECIRVVKSTSTRKYNIKGDENGKNKKAHRT